ncbi:FumA C-terminus/TtdB family hydratase beta subunit [Brevibacterium sp. BRM-1]|uniref:FumA C-terminus/TtdB family hydratase beta subunit n=1 Tax=Brevibacterium sp. BRM-1 TaxID=2999062 RepID=UPI002282DA88|nr:FumA C-terminus/TtdB family hydratase beta subunit [Brevibacterium sp. BRM-1]WAL39779.1 FumA C-terminus/TtdB family hydratase beta subunit [Brevibacterium sp. BRM-1]
MNAEFERLDICGVTTEKITAAGTERTVLTIAPSVFEELAVHAYKEISHFLRADHLASLRRIIDDPGASDNDRFVALDLLRNAVISAGETLPMCQDTGTAIISVKRPARIWTDGRDAEYLTAGIRRAYEELNLRYSQLAPLTLFDETNTGTNLPAQIEIGLSAGEVYELLFMAKGGGSANKSFLYQETKSVLDETRLMEFLAEKISSLGTAACPPYHLAIVVGGTSAEFALKTAKLASAHYLDELPREGDAQTGHALRDERFEQRVQSMTETLGFGAQFGGKYFCHDVRVVRLPRHNGSLPIAIAVSCSADRQAVARITGDGVFFEKLEHDPARFLPPTAVEEEIASESVTPIDLDQPMTKVLAQLAQCEVGDRLSLSGTLIVARDIVHARIRDMLAEGQSLPEYFLTHPIYYAGPAKTPEGMPSGSFGPTTAARMDPYIPLFHEQGGSLVTLAKGNRAPSVAESCATHGGFYLGTVGGPAARLAAECITDVRVVDMEDLGMEAVWSVRVTDFPAFVVIDDHGNDFFAHVKSGTQMTLSRTRTAADGDEL